MAKTWIAGAGISLAPSLFFRIQHWRMHRRFGSHRYWANLRDPRTFNEKLLRSKLDGEHAALGHLVDKAAVKGWVSERIGSSHVIPTVGVYEDAESVPLAELPRPCILKPTHASGHVVILKGGDGELAAETIRERMRRWLRINHYDLTGEPQYRGIVPRIICEPLLGGGKSDLPDYKLFCFHGEPAFIQIDMNRHTRHVRRFYDTQWQPQSFTLRYPIATREVRRPEPFDRMMDIARELSSGFSFVRVDLYAVKDSVYFGEITFHPESGSAPFSSFDVDLSLGFRMTSNAT